MAGIARGRSCASVLVIPRRKMALVRALRGGQPWPAKGSSPERKGRREERGRGEGAGWGLVGELGVRPCCSVRYARERLMPMCRSVRAEDEKEERETKKKRKDNKRKKKIWKIF
jgi:hypothetical protein